jgi:hypothetical protein
MVAALADYFFIAGLEGHEPAIVSSSVNYRGITLKDVPVVQEPIIEESTGDIKGTVVDKEEESEGTRLNDVLSLSVDVSIPTVPHFTDSISENGSSSNAFEDVMEKFSSERDEFLLTLEPPTIPITPRSTTPIQQLLIEEEEEDHIAELNHLEGRAPSPLRARTSLRSKIADLSRRASHSSRSNTLRRANTNGTPL